MSDSNLGISIIAGAPIFSDRTESIELADQVLSYSHEITAMGGYAKASFSLSGRLPEIEDWFENGLGRDITTYDEAGELIWNGFVNQVRISIGGRSITRGPLMEVANRVKVVYSTVDTSVTPPVVGNRKVTAVADDAASQARYGVLEEIYSTSGCTDANALLIRDTLLGESREPDTSDTISYTGNDPVVNVDCLGYVEYLNRFSYNSATTGNQNLSAKISAVLAADPNNAITPGIITANTLQVAAFENSDKRGLEVIRGEVKKGDASGNRWLFGVYGRRRAFYGPAPTTYAYQYNNSQEIMLDAAGREIMPWNVMPGRWVFTPDFLTARTIEASPLSDPRATFIESVSYAAPYGLDINGSKNSKLNQILARLGLGGAA